MTESSAFPETPAQTAKSQTPAYAYGLFTLLGVCFLTVFALTASNVVASWVRWSSAVAWVGFASLLMLVEYEVPRPFRGFKLAAEGVWKLLGGKPADAFASRGTLDRWTAAHGSVGLLFGIWFLPAAVVLAITVVWELYELVMPGQDEFHWNRALDVLFALAAWAVVIGYICSTKNLPIPFM